MFLCVKDIEYVYLYNLTSIKSGTVIYLCFKDIVPIFMILPVLIQERHVSVW